MRSAVGSVGALDASGRRFESCRLDQKNLGAIGYMDKIAGLHLAVFGSMPDGSTNLMLP